VKYAPLIALVGTIFLLALAAPADAQLSQTWVSGVGNDSDTCSRTAPCKTFAGAISKTNAGGEIDCLDPGGFGALTITKSLTIDCEKTSNGGVLVSGTPGIAVTSGTVILRGLDFDGIGSGTTGVNITGGATVHIQNSKIEGFITGVSLASGVTLVMTNTRIENNTVGVLASGGMVLRDVIIDDNTGNGITVLGNATVTVDRTTIEFNGGTGLSVTSSSATALLGNSTITGNGTGVSVSAGALYSFKQNQIAGNTLDGTPIAAFPGPGGPLQ
jgi:hypothetical protein